MNESVLYEFSPYFSHPLDPVVFSLTYDPDMGIGHSMRPYLAGFRLLCALKSDCENFSLLDGIGPQ